ncbi:MAG: cation diffusion facilitator family transporter [Ruminiclostridium sp.]
MIKLLSKIFIKNYTDYGNPAVRNQYGVLTGIMGIVLNLLLFAGKFLAGILTASIAVTADAFNNLSDAGTSIITMVGFKIAGMPADNEHPFGHGRVEYVAGLLVSIVIIIMGFELGKGSVEKIFNPEEITFSALSLGILIASVLVKLYICLYNRKIGKLINSATMKATAMDSLSDCISTISVIIGLVVFLIWNVNIDGYVGLIVAVFIFKTGLGTVKESLTPLLGEKADEDYIMDIKKSILSYDNIIGVHDLIVHNYGVGENVISLHAEVPATMGFMEAHEMIDMVENDLKKKYASCVTIHMDPVEADTEQSLKYKLLVNRAITSVNENITMHDFRMTDGVKCRNLIFDIEVPFKLKQSDSEIAQLITAKIKEQDENLNAVISVDKKVYR